MADPNDQTQSGLDAARETQAQLGREDGKPNAPTARFPEDEARLKSVRTDIRDPLANTAATSAASVGGAASNDLITQKVIEILASLATDPFALVKLGIQDAQRTALENNLRSAGQTPSPSAENAAAGSNDPKPPATNSINTASTSPIPSSSGPAALGLAIPQPQSKGDLANKINDAGKVSEAGQPSFAGSGSASTISSDSFSGAADLHAQALQVSGARMQAVLEQNTQLTVSLFDQVMNLLDVQNGTLGEMGRKISELSGQIKSLKNP